MRGKGRLGVPGRKRLARIRRAGLHEHRPALRRTRQIERPGHIEIGTVMIDCADALAPEVETAFAIVDDRIVGPAIPERLHDLDELIALVVALGMG